MSYSRRQLEALGEFLGESVTRKEGGRIVYGGGGSSSGTQTTTTDVPEWARDTAKRNLAGAEALAVDKPYQSYTNWAKQEGLDPNRVAGFNRLQNTAFQGAEDLKASGAMGQGIGFAQQATQRALNMGYRPGQFQNQFQAPGQFQAGQFNAQQTYAPELQQFQMQGPADVQSQGYDAATMGAAQSDYNPQLQAFQMGPAERVQSQSVGTPLMSAAQSGFSSQGLQDFQMGPAERVETQSFAQPGSADAYMSPYMQSVVGIQQREAQRAADIASTQRGAQAAKLGAFGGSRQAIMDAEAARNLAQQKGDIQATGLQSAFQNAQQQFNAEQQARLAAQQANQQAGLTVGQQNLAARQATQQLGFGADLQTSLANLSSSQQANVQNQAAQLQSQGLNAQQAMQAALANQQAGLTVGQQNLASQQSTQQLGTQTGLQTALANLSSQQQANVQNQAAQNQAMGMNAQQAMQAALANQQAGLTTGQQNLAAQLGIQQLGAGQNLQSQLANQQFGMTAQQLAEQSRQFGAGQDMTSAQQRAQFGQSAQQLAEQSRQYGAGLGLQGLQAAMTGAGQIGALGSQQFGQQKDVLGLQNQFGSQQQAQEQAKLGYNMQDYSAALRYPYQQVEFLSNILRGTPMGTVQTMYGAQPTMAQNIGALGMGAYGLNQMVGRAGGGTVSSYADGGSVDSSQNIESIVDKLSDPQLKQAAEAAQMRGDVEQLQIIQQEMAMRASERNGMAGAFNQLPQAQQQQMMASGGVVAFAGDEDENEAGLGQLVGGMMPSEGNPEVYKKLTGYFPQLLANVAGAKPTRMSEEDYAAARDKALEQYKKIAGPSPYEGLAQQIGEMREEGATGLRQAKGLAALKAASAMMQGRGLVRGLAQAGGAFGESYGQALQADKAQKRSLMNMEIQMADARRKENLGLYKEAEAAAERARKSKESAGEFGLKKANALANVAGKFATATKPTKAAGSGAPKPLKLAEQLAAAEIAHETNPTEATLATVNALRRAVAQTKTTDFGPTRAGLGEAGLDVRIGEAITTAQQKIKFTPEYLKADEAGKARMLRDAATQVRQNAGVNTNSTSGSGSGTVEGLPAGATVKGDKVYDSSGKLIGHVK